MNEDHQKIATQKQNSRHRSQFSFAILLVTGTVFMGSLLLGAKGVSAAVPARAHMTLCAEIPQVISEVSVSAEAPLQEDIASANTAALQKTAADWQLTLVNPWHTLPEGYEVTLKQLKNGQAVDERCYPDLQLMMDACRSDGANPVICSSYRTQEKQERLFNRKMNQYKNQGYSAESARVEAGKVVAVPGTSEHQLGLAVDIVDLSNQNLDESQEDTAVQKWLMQNSWKYGFILRYPSEKSELTGIIYEPWHYRYVGKAAAKEIYDQGICLEEYLK